MADPSFREGDWNCERCGDHQFERNIMCRKCGAPKPAVSSNNQTAKAGDWICPNAACGDVQFERNMLCRRCGTPRPSGTLAQKGAGAAAAGGLPQAAAAPGGGGGGGGGGVKTVFAPEDWICAGCGDHQFARNAACRRCGAPKPAPRSTGRVGDWICPNPQCQDLQFERNQACRRCGTPKPPVGVAAQAFGAPALGAMQACGAVQAYGCGAAARAPPPHAGGGTAGAGGAAAAAAPEDWTCASCGDHQFARNIACRKCGAPKPVTSTNNQAAKMGDWICPNPACRDVQFERNQACRRCGTAKPGGIAGRQAGGYTAYRPPAPAGFGMGAGAGAGAGARALRPGDWTCPNPACGDVQFERNQKCRMCGAEKPQVSTNRQVFKAGDWICPNPACGDVQFERNQACRQCGTAKPGAEGGAEQGRSRSPHRAGADGA